MSKFMDNTTPPGGSNSEQNPSQEQDPTVTRYSAVDGQEAAPKYAESGPIILAPGERPLLEYELVVRLGRGGCGEVWKVIGPGGVVVAMKFILMNRSVGAAEIRSLNLTMDKRHPQLTGVSGVWERGEYLIIAMDLGDCTLMDRLKEFRKSGQEGIPEETLIGYMHEIAKGIDFLNSHGIQHRDIKPQNILLFGGGIKLADFGLAKYKDELLSNNSGKMTPIYAPPEFFQGRFHSRSDLYSLAITYCELRSGKTPFTGDPATLMAGHLFQPPDLSMLPVMERDVVARALAKTPEDRWPDCVSFVKSLEQVNRQKYPIETPPDKSSSWKMIRYSGLILIAIAIAFVGSLLLRGRAGPDPLSKLRRQEIEREITQLVDSEPLILTKHPINYREVDTLPPNDNSSFEIISDDRIVDMRKWKNVPNDKLNEQYSGITQMRRIRLRKLKPVATFDVQGRTTGLDVIFDYQGPYPFFVTGQKGIDIYGRDRMKVRAITIDVSKVPVNSEFDLRVASTFWNSLQTEEEQWFGVVGYERSFKTSLLLVFPQEKPFEEVKLMVARTVKDKPTLFEGERILLADDTHRWVYWEIPNPEAHFVYQLYWDW